MCAMLPVLCQNLSPQANNVSNHLCFTLELTQSESPFSFQCHVSIGKYRQPVRLFYFNPINVQKVVSGQGSSYVWPELKNTERCEICIAVCISNQLS